MPLLYFIPQSHDCLERLDHCVPVVFLLGIRKLVVWTEIWMQLVIVVPPLAVAPTFLDTADRPVIMVVLSECLH